MRQHIAGQHIAGQHIAGDVIRFDGVTKIYQAGRRPRSRTSA